MSFPHLVFSDPDCKDVIPYKGFIFNGGEPHVVIDSSLIKDKSISVTGFCRNSNEFLSMLMLIDTIAHLNPSYLQLYIPYIPGGRMDRRMLGEPFSLRVYANIIKQLPVDRILTIDPHSDVTSALLDNKLTIIALDEFIPDGYDGYIIPDAGARKKVEALAERKGVKRLIYGNKHRDTSNGILSNISLSEVPNGNWLVVDDICDGGATFIALACKAKEMGMQGNLDLWVTHGIFSKGIDDLKKVYRNIYCLNPFRCFSDVILPKE